MYYIAKDKEFDFAATFWLSTAHAQRRIISAGKIFCFSRAFQVEMCKDGYRLCLHVCLPSRCEKP